MIKVRSVASIVIAVLVLSACATRSDPETSKELATYLRATTDSAVMNHFEWPYRLWRAGTAGGSSSHSETAQRDYYSRYVTLRPSKFIVAVSDRPGEDAPSDSPLGAAMRHMAAQLRENGIDIAIVSAMEPHNFLVESMPPNIEFGTEQLRDRLSERDVRPNLKAISATADIYVRRKFDDANCTRSQFNFIERPVELRAGNIWPSVRAATYPAARYVGALREFRNGAFAALARDAIRGDTEAFWVDLSIACGLNMLIFGNADLERYQTHGPSPLSGFPSGTVIITTSSHRPPVIVTVESIKDPGMIVREPPGIGPPGAMYTWPTPPAIPTQMLSTVRLILFLSVPIDPNESPETHYQGLVARLKELRAKYNAPAP